MILPEAMLPMCLVSHRVREPGTIDLPFFGHTKRANLKASQFLAQHPLVACRDSWIPSPGQATEPTEPVARSSSRMARLLALPLTAWAGQAAEETLRILVAPSHPPSLLAFSLPELADFKLFGKTILVVNKEFKLFLASQLGK